MIAKSAPRAITPSSTGRTMVNRARIWPLENRERAFIADPRDSSRKTLNPEPETKTPPGLFQLTYVMLLYSVRVNDEIQGSIFTSLELLLRTAHNPIFFHTFFGPK